MEQLADEDVIRGSGLPYVIVRPCGTLTDDFRGAPLELSQHGGTIAQVWPLDPWGCDRTERNLGSLAYVANLCDDFRASTLTMTTWRNCVVRCCQYPRPWDAPSTSNVSGSLSATGVTHVKVVSIVNVEHHLRGAGVSPQI